MRRDETKGIDRNLTNNERKVMDERVANAINAQVTMEFQAAYLYLGMSAWFDSQKLPGFAHWMRLQAKEEVVHAEKFIDHLLDRGAVLELGAIAAPPTDFGTVREAIEAVAAHEEKVSASIHAIYDTALNAGDHASRPLLNWFVEEQIEEERVARDLIDRLDLAGDDRAALIAIDQELGKRVGADQ